MQEELEAQRRRKEAQEERRSLRWQPQYGKEKCEESDVEVPKNNSLLLDSTMKPMNSVTDASVDATNVTNPEISNKDYEEMAVPPTSILKNSSSNFKLLQSQLNISSSESSNSKSSNSDDDDPFGSINGNSEKQVD